VGPLDKSGIYKGYFVNAFLFANNLQAILAFPNPLLLRRLDQNSQRMDYRVIEKETFLQNRLSAVFHPETALLSGNTG
jgi:hypothetical protein